MLVVGTIALSAYLQGAPVQSTRVAQSRISGVRMADLECVPRPS